MVSNRNLLSQVCPVFVKLAYPLAIDWNKPKTFGVKYVIEKEKSSTIATSVFGITPRKTAMTMEKQPIEISVEKKDKAYFTQT